LVLLLNNRAIEISEKNTRPFSRIKSIDTVRGFATVAMVIFHFVTWYLPQESQYEIIRFAVSTLFATPLRFCFITIPAMGVSLQIHASKLKGIDEKIVRKSIIKRGLILIIIQFFCNFLGLYPVVIWNSFILSFVGISIIVSYFVIQLSKRTRLILIILIVLLTPFLKFHFFYLFLQTNFIQNTWTVENFFYSMFLQVDFPIFPYISFSIFGTIYTEFMIDCFENKREEVFVKKSLIYGSIMIIAYFIFSIFRSFINYPDFFLNRPTRMDFLFCCGSVMLWISIFYWIQDWKQQKTPAFVPFEILGMISLTTYITHYYIFQKIMDYIYDPWLNLKPYTIFQLFLIIMIIHIIYGILVLRNKRKYSVEWFLRKCV